MTQRHTLMIPGPVELSEEALHEMGMPVVAHYGSDWVEIYRETVGLLKQVFQTDDDIYLLVGSGTAGLDAAIGGFLKNDEKALVLINGGFAERLLRIALAYHLDACPLRFDVLRPITTQPVEEFLTREKDTGAVLMVHHETLTGVVNPVQEISQLCKEHDVPLILDAVSSLGGIDLRVGECGVDICVTGSQKGLESPPGLALISISEKAWRLMDAKGPTGHGFYLDPRVWREYLNDWGHWHPSHATMATSIVLALRASLQKIMNEGLEEHFARYRRVSRVIKGGLESIGFELLTREAYASPTVTVGISPADIRADSIRDFLRDERDILIALGPEPWNAIRIGHMGEGLKLDHIVPLLIGLEDALRAYGKDISYGQSLTRIPTFWKG